MSQHCSTEGGVLLGVENGKFWPILALLTQIYTFFWRTFTDITNAVVYQN